MRRLGVRRLRRPYLITLLFGVGAEGLEPRTSFGRGKEDPSGA